MATSNAPDVDLRAQGFPPQVLLALGALGVSLYMYGGGAPPEGTEPLEEAEDGKLWPLWMLMWGLWRLLQLVLLLVLTLLGVLIARQRSMMYVPVPPNMQRSPKLNPPMYRSPERWSLPFQDAFITTADGVRIHAWFVYQPVAKCQDGPVPTLICFHGNAGNIGHRLENVRDMHANLGVNLLVVDYRGFGDSEDGEGPCEEGFVKDALAAYWWVVHRSRSPPADEVTAMSEDRIILFGQSIGGAVAIQCAARLLRERLSRGTGEEDIPLPAGLVLENTFTSMRDMATQVFPPLKFAGPLLRWPLLLDEWRSAESLRYFCQNHTDWACCLLSGERDEIVPAEQMRQLRAVLDEGRPRIVKYFKFPRGMHNDTPQQGGAEYWASYNKYLALVVADLQERRSRTAGASQG